MPEKIFLPESNKITHEYEDELLLFSRGIHSELIHHKGRPYMFFRIFNRYLMRVESFHCHKGFISFYIPIKIRYVGYLTYQYDNSNDDLEKRLKTLEESQEKIKSQISKPLPLKGRDTVYTIAIKEKK